MLAELATTYSVQTFVAVLEAANFRSSGLLQKLGFQPGTNEQAEPNDALPDEITLVKPANPERASGAG
jgi:L-amino acid N-acyltransferase YncA